MSSEESSSIRSPDSANEESTTPDTTPTSTTTTTTTTMTPSAATATVTATDQGPTSTKKRAAAGEPNGPTKVTKRRAARACVSCRARKVRCDVVEKNPCGNCRWDGVECVVQESRRRRYVSYLILADKLLTEFFLCLFPFSFFLPVCPYEPHALISVPTCSTLKKNYEIPVLHIASRTELPLSILQISNSFPPTPATSTVPTHLWTPEFSPLPHVGLVQPRLLQWLRPGFTVQYSTIQYSTNTLVPLATGKVPSTSTHQHT